jgi:small-conductance mechanosensitive channel
VITVFQKALTDLKPTLDGIIDGPTVLGIEEVNELGAKVRIWAKGAPIKHWNISRAVNKTLKKACDDNDIKLASPHRIITIETGHTGSIEKDENYE